MGYLCPRFLKKHKMKRIVKKYGITGVSMDMDYHITPSGIILYIQETIANFLTSHNVAAFDVLPEGRLWVISDYNVSLEAKQPYWPAEVSVELWLGERGGARAYFDYVMRDGKDEIFARGTSCWSMIDANTHRPLRLDDHISHIEVEPEMVFGSHAKADFPTPETLFAEYDYKTLTTDVDFNSHITNRAYLMCAMGGVDLDFERRHNAKRIYMKFLHETFQGETLHCKAFSCKDAPQTICYQIFNDSQTEVCRIWIEWQDREFDLYAVKKGLVR